MFVRSALFIDEVPLVAFVVRDAHTQAENTVEAIQGRVREPVRQIGTRLEGAQRAVEEPLRKVISALGASQAGPRTCVGAQK